MGTAGHISVNPAMVAKLPFNVDRDFEPVFVEGFFDKRLLDKDFVRNEESRISTAWRRLQAIPSLGLALPEYPLSITPA